MALPVARGPGAISTAKHATSLMAFAAAFEKRAA
jgi:hypothetical protein